MQRANAAMFLCTAHSCGLIKQWNCNWNNNWNPVRIYLVFGHRCTSRVCMPASCTATAPSNSLLIRLDSCVFNSSLSDKLRNRAQRSADTCFAAGLTAMAVLHKKVLLNDMLLKGCLLLSCCRCLKVGTLQRLLYLRLVLQLTF